jgi:hypothetical protein
MNEAVISGALEQPEQLSGGERLQLTWALVWPCALLDVVYCLVRSQSRLTRPTICVTTMSWVVGSLYTPISAYFPAGRLATRCFCSPFWDRHRSFIGRELGGWITMDRHNAIKLVRWVLVFRQPGEWDMMLTRCGNLNSSRSSGAQPH